MSGNWGKSYIVSFKVTEECQKTDLDDARVKSLVYSHTQFKTKGRYKLSG